MISLLQKKDFPGRVYFFDIGKIKSVLPNDKCDDGTRASVNVKYDEGDYPVPLNLEDYASDKVKWQKRNISGGC